MAALMTEAANCSPFWMSWGFSSDELVKFGSTRLKAGRVPAAASAKYVAIGRCCRRTSSEVGEQKARGKVRVVVLPRIEKWLSSSKTVPKPPGRNDVVAPRERVVDQANDDPAVRKRRFGSVWAIVEQNHRSQSVKVRPSE